MQNWNREILSNFFDLPVGVRYIHAESYINILILHMHTEYGPNRVKFPASFMSDGQVYKQFTFHQLCFDYNHVHV